MNAREAVDVVVHENIDVGVGEKPGNFRPALGETAQVAGGSRIDSRRWNLMYGGP